jgi:hypothetical protein
MLGKKGQWQQRRRRAAAAEQITHQALTLRAELGPEVNLVRVNSEREFVSG